MTTDPTPLQERMRSEIGYAIRTAAAHGYSKGKRGTDRRDQIDALIESTAAAVLPIIAAGVRKAQADAWDEGYEAGMLDTYRLGRDMDLTITPAPNPYRETGDRA